MNSILHLMALAIALTGVPLSATAQQTNSPATVSTRTCDDWLVEANVLFKQGKLDDALAAARAAQNLDAKRFEAPATAALILHAAGKTAEAKAALEEATRLAPPDKQEKVQAIAKLLAAEPPAKMETAAATASPPPLTGAARRQYDALVLIIEEADKATLADERNKLLREFLDKSEPFLKGNSDQLPVWTLRAVVALELNKEKEATQAGAELIRLGAENSDDAKSRKVMAMLDRKGWLKTPEQIAKSQAEEEKRQAADSDEVGQLFQFISGTDSD